MDLKRAMKRAIIKRHWLYYSGMFFFLVQFQSYTDTKEKQINHTKEKLPERRNGKEMC